MKTNGFIIIFLLMTAMVFAQDVKVNDQGKTTPATFIGVLHANANTDIPVLQKITLLIM